MSRWSQLNVHCSHRIPRRIQAIGAGIFTAHLASYLYFAGASIDVILTLDFLASMVSVVPFVGTIIVGSYLFEQADIPSKHYLRISKWFAGGLVSFLLLNLGMILYWSTAPLSWDIAWALWAAAVGGAAGLIAGTFEARSITRAVEAERYRLQREAVEERNERLDEFAAIVAHDLRNPLHVAAGNLELARETADPVHLDRIDTALGRMESIIEKTLTLARSGHVISEPERVDLAASVADSWNAVPTGDGTLQTDAAVDIEADPDRLRHLFENFFRNSIEHGTPDGTPKPGGATETRTDGETRAGESDLSDLRGDSADRSGNDADSLTIRVGTMADGFYVADDGPGIPPEKRDAVLSEGYSTGDGGGGLGLAIVQRIVDAHGWSLHLTESADQGARFEITGVEMFDVDADPDQGPQPGSGSGETAIET